MLTLILGALAGPSTAATPPPAPTPAPPAPAPPATAAPTASTDWVQLRAPAAFASSYLVSDWNKFTENYHPSYVLDGDPATAWVEGAPGSGQGQSLWVDLSGVQGVRAVKLRLRNGYHKSAKLLTANAAAAALKVSLRWGDTERMAADWAVKRELGWQELVLTPTVPLALDRVKLQVAEVIEGRVYQDLCISDLEVWVQASTPYSAPVENAKHAALERWVTERVQRAKRFQALPADYPFASPDYRSEPSDPPPPATLDARYEQVELQVAKLRGAGPAPSEVNLSEPMVQPEGLPLHSSLWPYLGVGAPEEADADEEEEENAQGFSYHRFDTLAPTGRTEGERTELAFASTETFTERTTTVVSATTWVELVGQQLRRATVYSERTDEEMPPFVCAYLDIVDWTFTWRGGRLVEAVQVSGSRCQERLDEEGEPVAPSEWRAVSRQVYRPQTR